MPCHAIRRFSPLMLTPPRLSVEKGAQSFAMGVGAGDADILELVVGHLEQLKAAATALQRIRKSIARGDNHHNNAAHEARQAGGCLPKPAEADRFR